MKHPITQYTTHRLVRSEHLNHHGTLYAGRGAEWFVESGFVAASQLLPAENLICVQIDSLHFQRSVRCGEVVCYNSRILYAGRTSLVAYIRVRGKKDDKLCSDSIVDGFATFVHVDDSTRPVPHGLEMEPACEEDFLLIEKFQLLRGKNLVTKG